MKKNWLPGERDVFFRNYINIELVYNNKTFRPNLEQSIGALFTTVKIQ